MSTKTIQTDESLLGQILAEIFRIRDTMATKDDLKSMEAGIRRDMATKEDLIAMETRIRRDMATKEDLISMENGIRRDMATKDDISSIRAEMATQEDIQSLADQVVEFTTIVNEDLYSTARSHGKRLDRLEHSVFSE